MSPPSSGILTSIITDIPMFKWAVTPPHLPWSWESIDNGAI